MKPERIGALVVEPTSPLDGALVRLVGSAALDRREVERLIELLTEIVSR